MDGHKTVCPPNATMKRPHVTAAVTKMRSLAAITRHESGKDFSWGGGANRAVSTALHSHQLGAHCHRGPKISTVAMEVFLWACPLNKAPTPPN